MKKNTKLAGEKCAKEIIKQTAADNGKLAITFLDGLSGNGADTVRGIQKIMGKNFNIVGGAAGDDFLFKKTYQYINNQVLSDVTVGALLTGEVKFGIGVRHGWKPIGTSRLVTKAQGAVLYEIDNKPAVQIYEEYFGRQAKVLRSEPLARIAITYPLGIKVADSDEYLIRDAITVGPKGELNCAAEVPMGARVCLMMGSKEAAIEAAKQAAKQCWHSIKQQGGSKITTALIFNCIARDKLLAQDACNEITAIKNVLGKAAEMIGFYTYGEVAPIGRKLAKTILPHSEFCNETVVILGLGM